MNAQSAIECDPIEAFRPWEDDDKKAVRRRLMNARNIAALRAVRVESDVARRLYWEANGIANRWCFAAANVDNLTDIANAVVRLFLTAGTVERVEGADGK